MIKRFLLFAFVICCLYPNLGQSTFNGSELILANEEEVVAEETPQHLQSDADLQQSLEKVLKANPQWRSLIASKKMAVSLVDMRNPGSARLAQINGDHMMYAASLPKIAVLLASMDAIEQGELVETQAVKEDMRLMIARSNNQATTRMIDRVGFEKIEAVLTDPRYKLYDKEHGGGLWVGKRYASQGRRYPDPLKGLSHAATSNQVCNFYYLLAQDALVSPERSQEMKKIMINPELHHKFVNTLDRIAPNASVYRKSGSWNTFHSDSAMVIGPDRNYILVALIDDANGEMICRELVTAAERALKAMPAGA